MFVKFIERHFCLAVLLAFVVLLTPTSSYSQPASYYESTGHWYQVVSRTLGVTLEMCADSAVARGGYLASIHSQGENDFILSVAGSESHTFIGAFEPSEGVWQWYSGEPWGFTNWKPNEPNNCGGGACSEEVIQLYTSGPYVGKWNDCKNNDAQTLTFVVEYNSKPSWANWCDDFDDGTGWLNRWQPLEGSQNLVGNPVHSGAQAVEFHGTCGSTVIRRNFVAKEGYYTAWFNQRHHQAGFSMAIQVQQGSGVNPFYRDCYQIRLHAANAQPPGTFVFERQSSSGTGYILASGTPSFLKDEWIQVFIRRLPGNVFVAGYDRNGVRDSLICSDPNPPISAPGSIMLWACSDVPPYTYFDDACYNSMSIGNTDTLRIGKSNCLQSLLPSQQVIPIYLDNRDTVKGFDIPLVYNWAVNPVSVSFDTSTRMNGHTGMTGTIDAANKRIRIGWVEGTGNPANALLPIEASTENVPIAKIVVSVPYACFEDFMNAPDTTTIMLPLGPVGLEVSDKNANPTVPVVVRDSTRMRHFIQGDVDFNGLVTISDAVFTINYIFSGGPAPVCFASADVDGNGIVNISDAVILINYIFAGGATPGASQLCSYVGSFFKSQPATAHIEALESVETSSKTIDISAQSSSDLQAVQLDFNVFGEVRDLRVSSSDQRLQVFDGVTDGEYRVGLIDLTARTTLQAGKHRLATISYSGEGELTLQEAIVVNSDAEQMITTFRSSKAEGGLPAAFALAQNQPNPFNPSTDISFSLPKADRVTLVVYNILGEEIAALVDEVKAAGVHRVTWDGNDKSGRAVASGVYFYKLVASEFSQSRKMLLLK